MDGIKPDTVVLFDKINKEIVGNVAKLNIKELCILGNTSEITKYYDKLK